MNNNNPFLLFILQLVTMLSKSKRRGEGKRIKLHPFPLLTLISMEKKMKYEHKLAFLK
jgi:hypothetical protein